MEREKTLGMELKKVSILMDRRMHSIISANGVEDITPMHGKILGYLLRRSGEDVYQKDIEAEFRVTRSTVTSLLKLMEQKGYILRESVFHDARLKRLRITPMGESAFLRIEESIHQFENLLCSAFTKQESETLLELLGKLKSALTESV